MNKIIAGFKADEEFNIYELVSESVSYKCILPSQNELIMDTYYTIKEYLLANNFLNEIKEMASYTLTGKGIELKMAGSLNNYEEKLVKKNKKTLLQTLFSKDTNKPNDHLGNAQVKYYE